MLYLDWTFEMKMYWSVYDVLTTVLHGLGEIASKFLLISFMVLHKDQGKKTQVQLLSQV